MAAVVKSGIVVDRQVLLLWHKSVHLLASLARILAPLVDSRSLIVDLGKVRLHGSCLLLLLLLLWCWLLWRLHLRCRRHLLGLSPHHLHFRLPEWGDLLWHLL